MFYIDVNVYKLTIETFYIPGLIFMLPYITCNLISYPISLVGLGTTGMYVNRIMEHNMSTADETTGKFYISCKTFHRFLCNLFFESIDLHIYEYMLKTTHSFTWRHIIILNIGFWMAQFIHHFVLIQISYSY